MKLKHHLSRFKFEYKTAGLPPRRRGQQLGRFAIVTAFMLATVLAGCGDPNRTKIIGTWEVESAASITSRFKETDVESSNSDDSRMSVEFRSNGVLKTQTRMSSMNHQKEGTWKLLSFDESSSTMRLKCILGLQETEHEIEFLDQDTIQMDPPNMAGLEMKLRFTRAGKERPTE